MEQGAEGVIRFDLRYRKVNIAEPGDGGRGLTQLFHWHQVMRRLGWLGRQANRYGGCAYGNLSMRSGDDGRFIVSATQTGDAALNQQRVCEVLSCDLQRNQVVARGPMKPSSEALTHGAVFRLSADINWVFHIHQPTIWQHAQALGLPMTDPQIAYGTPAMAREMRRLFDPWGLSQGLLAMAGHEDGIISFASNAETAALLLFEAYCAATGREFIAGTVFGPSGPR